MLGIDVPLLEQGAVQFMLMVVMLLTVATIIWFTLAK